MRQLEGLAAQSNRVPEERVVIDIGIISPGG